MSAAGKSFHESEEEIPYKSQVTNHRSQGSGPRLATWDMRHLMIAALGRWKDNTDFRQQTPIRTEGRPSRLWRDSDDHPFGTKKMDETAKHD